MDYLHLSRELLAQWSAKLGTDAGRETVYDALRAANDRLRADGCVVIEEDEGARLVVVDSTQFARWVRRRFPIFADDPRYPLFRLRNPPLEDSLTTVELWALVALECYSGLRPGWVTTLAEELALHGWLDEGLALLLAEAHPHYVLDFERRMGRPPLKVAMERASHLVDDRWVGACFLASLAARIPVGDSIWGNYYLRGAEQLSRLHCVASKRQELTAISEAFRDIVAKPEPHDREYRALAERYRDTFSDQSTLALCPMRAPLTPRMRTPQYIGAWYSLRSVVTEALGPEGQVEIHGSRSSYSRAEWLVGYLVGSDAEYEHYGHYQFLKYQCGGDPRGIDSEPFTLVTPANRELLARRVMLFDRFIWPRTEAAPRELEEGLALIDSIAASEKTAAI